MAESKTGSRPRIRKSAPTLRQRQEAAVASKENPKKRRTRSLFAKLVAPFKKLRLSDRKFFKFLGKIFRKIGSWLYWLVPKYFINSWKELRLVVWPSRWETWRLTLAVFIFAIVFGALVAVVDRALDEVFKKVILK